MKGKMSNYPRTRVRGYRRIELNLINTLPGSVLMFDGIIDTKVLTHGRDNEEINDITCSLDTVKFIPISMYRYIMLPWQQNRE